MQNLVIVESPTKARTLEHYLGKDYQVIASMGHVRDLPKSEFGVDTNKNFTPQYIIPRDKRKTVNQLKKTAEGIKNIWLATDPDREGEAIAWHIGQIIGDRKSEVRRVVFHEITEEAIKDAFKHPRDLDYKLIDAQQARRVLDRLVGYKLSPLLWQKVKRGLSAGRVQSVALRLIVEREREITAFKPVEYWNIEADLETPKKEKFTASLIGQNGKKLEIRNQQEADGHVKNLEVADYTVLKVTKREVRRYPGPPFTTSTLQQTAVTRLGFTSKKTMMLAQNLYERGLITYMRTDSVNLAVSAISAARDYIAKFMGNKYLPAKPRVYRAKSRNVQEAHEAIRPTNVGRQSQEIGGQSGLNRDHARLYDLIWKRFVACQMNEAILDQTTVDVAAKGHLRDVHYLLRATGSVVKFDGWLKLYGKSLEKDEDDHQEKILPELVEGQLLNLLQLLPTQHFTEPPPRYTEASLIKRLEELGIGRPSTYAPILSTIQERYYVERTDRKFIPTALGFSVTDFLVKYFPDVFDYQFTAALEDELDEIARGERNWVPTMKTFYDPFEKKLGEVERSAKKVELAVEYAGKKCPQCGKELIVRVGRFGKFLACSGFPDCKYTEGMEEKINVKCPVDGGDLIVRKTRKGKTFYGCKNWPGCKYASWTKPKTAGNP